MSGNSSASVSISDFFKKLMPIGNWIDMGSRDTFTEIPDDWWIFLTDIKGSTKAIENGRYKDVNIVGACSILSVQNALKNTFFPFIFGGDGVTFFLPSQDREQALKALSYTRKIAKENFNFDLRIFSAPVRQLKSDGKTVNVSYVLSSSTKPYFLFHGGGITKAEELMKSNPEFLLEENFPAEGSHEGLECRWNPIPAKRGIMLVLIIKPLDESQSIESILYRIQDLLPGCQPLQADKMQAKWPPKDLLSEMRAKNLGLWPYIKALAYTALVYVFMQATRGIKNSPVDQYLQGVAKNNDFFKRDDNLRLVIDVNEEEKKLVYSILDDYKNNGLIQYGYHETDSALITCLVKDKNEHFHFIDGADGGYAKAATMLKKQKTV